MIVPGSEEIKGLLGSRGIAFFFFGSEGRFGVFSPSAGHYRILGTSTTAAAANSQQARQACRLCRIASRRGRRSSRTLHDTQNRQ